MKMIDVMKRLAELDLDNPNVVNENQNFPVATSAPRRDYDLETTITNPAYAAWENGAGDENNPPSETIEVGINYALDSDQDYNGRNFPVIDSSEVYDLATGQELNISDENTLDSIERAIWKDANDRRDDQYEDMSNQGNIGAHGEETTSPIHGGQTKEKTMENLNLESLRYLSGLKNTIAECGMMGGAGQPASINITAGSGQELTGMLKDIMNLAGVSKVEPHHMPVDSPDAGPSTVISAPPMGGAMGHKMDPNVEMHKLMAIVGEPEQEQDSMNSGEPAGEGDEEKMGEDNNRMYDSSPNEKVMGDPMAQFGDINSGDHRQRQAGLPIAKPMETTFKQLMADYEQFIAEGKMSYDKKTVQMKKDTTDSDQRHGLYINGKLVKTCNTKDEAANTKKRDPKFKTATIKKISESNHTQYYTDLNPEKKKPGIGSKIAGAAKKVFDKIGHADDDELISKFEKKTGGKRPNRYNAEGKDEAKKPSKDMSEHIFYKSGKSKDVLANRPDGGVAKYGDEYKGMVQARKIVAKKEKTGKEPTDYQKMASKAYGLSGPKGKLPETKK